MDFGTNETHFERLENPPAYAPTWCRACQRSDRSSEGLGRGGQFAPLSGSEALALRCEQSDGRVALLSSFFTIYTQSRLPKHAANSGNNRQLQRVEPLSPVFSPGLSTSSVSNWTRKPDAGRPSGTRSRCVWRPPRTDRLPISPLTYPRPGICLVDRRRSTTLGCRPGPGACACLL